MRDRRRTRFPIVLPVLLAVLCGCSRLDSPLVPNQAPTVRLTAAPPSSTDPTHYRVDFQWVGYDPDGRIAGYAYAVDPPSRPNADTLWVPTARSAQSLAFEVKQPAAPGSPNAAPAEFHVFAVRAEDNRGARSPVEASAFFAQTLAPWVKITSPAPDAAASNWHYVSSDVDITFEGGDPDGAFQKPIGYRWTLLTDSTAVTAAAAAADPDSVRRYYAPRGWAGWHELGPNEQRVPLRGLAPQGQYVFCIVALDDAGAYSPQFAFGENLTGLIVASGPPGGPIFTVWGTGFAYTFPRGVWDPTDPAMQIQTEVPANRAISINWFAQPVYAPDIAYYRWALDIADPNDQTPRSDEQTDLAHWSQPAVTLSATIPGFSPGLHAFYIEATDTYGAKSLVILRFRSIAATFARELLIVNDTRLLPDQRTSGTGCVNAPVGRWPTAAELDTFLFARGGYPWKCYPAGTVSPPGLFSGYAFDTVGTRNGQIDQTVSLQLLNNYRHLVWLSEHQGAISSNAGDQTQPMNALRYMASPGNLNTLATYVAGGGQLWLAGGGALTSATIPYDHVGNNNGGYGMTFSNRDGELIPGRFVYDAAKWQSTIRVADAYVQISRSFGRHPDDPFYSNSRAPAAIRFHDAAVDPYPPNRAGQSAGAFYYADAHIEYLDANDPNAYVEDVDPGPGEDFRSALDTLYVGTSGQMAQPPLTTSSDPPVNVLMTVYPARGLNATSSVVTTGFSLWEFRRDDCRALVDFVLGDLWFISPAPAAGQPSSQMLRGGGGGEARTIRAVRDGAHR